MTPDPAVQVVAEAKCAQRHGWTAAGGWKPCPACQATGRIAVAALRDAGFYVGRLIKPNAPAICAATNHWLKDTVEEGDQR